MVFAHLFFKGNICPQAHLNRLSECTINKNHIYNVFNFFSDPTPITTTLIPVIWEPVPTPQSFEGTISVVPYLLFDKELTNQLFAGNHLIFWDHIYRKFYKKHTNV